MTHQNTILSSAQLQIVAQWIVVVANQQKTRGGELSADGAAELLRDLLGNSITFAILRGLTGGMVVNELRDKSIKLPQIAAGIFTDFARKWTPEVPHCPNRKCGLPALRPLDDMSGIEVLPEGAICPWCDGKHNVSSGESQAALINWATGVAVPPTQQYDDTIVPGTRLPLQEEELMGMARDGLRKPLRAHEVPVHAWLRYLLTQGSAFQAFGIPQVPGRVLDSLENDSVIGCGVQLVNAQIITAKRWIEGGGMKPRAAGGGSGSSSGSGRSSLKGSFITALQRGDREASKELYRALEGAFPTVDGLTQMVRLGLDENLDAITSGNLGNRCFELVFTWGAPRCNLDKIFEAALKANPKNEKLQELAAR